MSAAASAVPEFWSRPEAKVCKPHIYRHHTGIWFVFWHLGAHWCCESWAEAVKVACRVTITTHQSVHCWMCHRQIIGGLGQ